MPYLLEENKICFLVTNFILLRALEKSCLVGVRQTAHDAHDAQHVVVHSVHTNLGRVGALDRGVRENKLQGRVVDAREVAGAGRLVLLRAQGEGVDVDARVRGAGVGVVRLHHVEVAALAL